MTTPRTCPQCGVEIPAASPSGLCPKCLLGTGLESQSQAAPCVAPTQPSPPAASAGFVPPTPEELAARFPQLEILELLGKGGMGAVYKARQRGLDRMVALKILPPEVGRDPAFAERFTREARALARLSHTHIVTVHDFGQSGGLYYFVMEYVDGVNLRQALQAGGLTPTDALAIVPQVCDALQFAHDEGIVHRDIKPENILIDKRGRVKIADFGLAKLLGHEHADSLTGTHQVMGTLRYMAPEQMEGSREVDHRADIYSLGVVFYELLTRELPIGRFAPPSKKVHIDVRLDEVVLRALEKEPEQRYQHASEVKSELQGIQQSSRTASAPAQAAPVAGRVPDAVLRRRVGCMTLVTISLAIAAIVGLQAGYLSDAQWYFKQELPYTYLSALFFSLSAVGLAYVTWWWYLLAKDPLEPASLADFRRRLTTPDPRLKRLGIWLPLMLIAGALVGGMPMLLELAGFGDTAQTIAMTTGLALCPYAVMAILWLIYRPEDGAGQARQASQAPRFSRLAILAAVWAPFFFVVVALTTVVSREGPGAQPTGPEWWQWLLIFTVLPLGMTAPFATTILGAIAVAQIRNSRGRLYGLWLALADALLYPLVFIDAAIAYLLLEVGRSSLLRDGVPSSQLWLVNLILIFATVVLILLVDVMAIVFAWRVVRTPVGMAHEPPSAPRDSQPPRPAPLPALATAVHTSRTATETGLAQMLSVAIGLVLGMLSATAGVLLLPAAFMLEEPGSGPFWGWMGAVFGCLAGGLGSIAGSWNTYRQLRGQTDWMQMNRWTGLDYALMGYGALGLVLVAGSLVLSALGVPRSVASPTMQATFPGAWLLGGLMILQAALFLLFRAAYVFQGNRDVAERTTGRVVAAVVVAIVALLVLVVGAMKLWPLQYPPITYTYFGDTGFVAGPNGPMLSEKKARDFGLPTNQLDEANRIFQAYHREYQSLERRHTRHTQDDQGRVHITIEPFADESLALIERLWAEISGLVDQRVAPPAPTKGHIHSSLGLFRHVGEATVTAELWRESHPSKGHEYFMKESIQWIDGSSSGRGSSGATLDAIPEEYRMYWTEPAGDDKVTG